MVQVYGIFFIVFVTTAVESTPFNITTNLLSTIEIVDNNSTFQKLYPEVELVLFSDEKAKAAAVLTHTLGKETLWDRMIGYGAKDYVFPTLQNFRLTLKYPAVVGERGSKVTYVEIKVLQTSNLGRAYVTAGGIGQRHITIVVEGLSTKRFKYEARIYNSASRSQALGLMAPLVSLLFFCSSSFSFFN